MKDVLKGKVWKFGDDISTDLITPGRYFHLRSDLNELAKHTLEDADPDFIKKISGGDFVVGGRNFGLGSSREHAPTVIKISGISAVLAKSFARIFYRNAINVGLPVIICDTDQIDTGDELIVSLTEGKIQNVTKKKEMDFPPLPKIMADILNEGGLVNYIKKNGEYKI
ncbi:MAG: 3-isopropylmalate dehydratase small subunit [Spirochaetes bacterium]|nr:3-isopropylmalate dehydratase small subunit [Spirochaetota bacterium]